MNFERKREGPKGRAPRMGRDKNLVFRARASLYAWIKKIAGLRFANETFWKNNMSEIIELYFEVG
ncbi:MAG: hypothetical protein A2052_02400 [Deltaproteobacteria bacterium GWA2_54_12]|nr:MAG: hypothetical protein A2052_02400 [Deltaproteobacteria bacterium GWA2_54_12]